MVWIKGNYGTNHPKDIAARRAKRLQQEIRARQCTKSEMFRPTETNVRKHIQETKSTSHLARELKETVKKLDREDRHWGNTETFRPKR